EDEASIHLLVEVEIGVVERLADVAKNRLLDATGEQAVLAPYELVCDERREKIDRHHFLRLRLQEARLERVGHSRQAQMPQCAAEFDLIHFVSPPSVMRVMRSRYSVKLRISGSTCLSESGGARWRRSR